MTLSSSSKTPVEQKILTFFWVTGLKHDFKIFKAPQDHYIGEQITKEAKDSGTMFEC